MKILLPLALLPAVVLAASSTQSRSNSIHRHLLDTQIGAAVSSNSNSGAYVGAFHNMWARHGSIATIRFQQQRQHEHSALVEKLISMRGGGGGANVDDFVEDAYDWCINLGAPAALIAGAVIGTLYENARGGQLELRVGDTPYVKGAKKLTSILLLSAFALQIISIFVTTVTGTVLRSQDFTNTATKAHNALEFMRENFEFEYLTANLSFLQGLLHWLGAVAVEFTIPSETEGRTAPKMDKFVAASLSTLILVLISFYNRHLTFYDNYFKMLIRWFFVSANKFFSFGPMAFFYVPGIFLSLFYGYLAIREQPYAIDISKESDD